MFTKERQHNHNINYNKSLNKKTGKNNLLAYAQYRKRTKPPAMIIEEKCNAFHFQPPKDKRLNLIYHLKLPSILYH